MISFFNTYPGFAFAYEPGMVSLAREINMNYDEEQDYINIIFLSDEELLKMNVEYLKHDYYTDIITFNYAEEPDRLEAELYISIDRVKDNAEKNGLLFNEEVNRVVIHGMLHLAGYEDGSPEEQLEMRAQEDKFLERLSFHVKPNKDKIAI